MGALGSRSTGAGASSRINSGAGRGASAAAMTRTLRTIGSTVFHASVSRIRTFIKAVESAIAEGKKADAADALKKVQPEIARGVARGVIHKNTAARKISRLSKRVASLG